MKESLFERAKRQWHEFLEAISHNRHSTPPFRQHRPSSGPFETGFQRLARPSESSTLPDISSVKRLKQSADTREIASEWLKALPDACTRSSIRRGDLRLRTDVPREVTDSFVELSRRVDEDLRNFMTRLAKHVVVDPSDDHIASAALETLEAVQMQGIGPTRIERLHVEREIVHRHILSVVNEPETDSPDGEIMQIRNYVTVNRQTSPIRRPSGATNIGSEPLHWDRYAEDQQIFASKRSGGTVLIDCSGSMNWDYEMLRRELKELPAATVALYSGLNGRGKLCIIAEKGRWADVTEDDLSGGNEIDIEALEWLAKQKGPRVWLSDGQIVGGTVSRIGASAAARRVRQVCSGASIVRADAVEHAVSTLKRPGRTPAGTYQPNNSRFVLPPGADLAITFGMEGF